MPGQVRAIAFGIIAVALVGACQATSQPTPMPASPTPPSATGSPTAPPAPGHQIGEQVRVDDAQYVTLVQVESSADGYSADEPPLPGNKVVAFLMHFEGIDPTGTSYNPHYFTLLADNEEYDGTPYGKEPQLGSNFNLHPGQTADGWVSFEAPKDAATLQLVYDLSGAAEPVTWSVVLP